MPIHSATQPSLRAHKQVKFSSETPRTIKKFNVRDPVSALHLPRTAIFNLPKRTPEELYEVLEKQKVIVTSLHYNFNHIRGSASVKNLSFEKEVSVRYTFDNWKTGSDRRAQYKGPVIHLQRGLVDEFIFEIDLQTSSKPTKLSFALRYTVEGVEHWDNNNGKDYQVEYTYTGDSRNTQKFHMQTKPIHKHSNTTSTEDLKIPDFEQFDVPHNDLKKMGLSNPSIQAHKELTRCPSFDSYVDQMTFDYTFHMPTMREMTHLY